MKHSPLVSVMTPCYNHEAYLDDYCASLIRQTYPNIEVVLIDDGSPDQSWPKIQSWESRLRQRLVRVVLIRQENAGFQRTLARALSEATGEYTCILESDDYYYPEKVAKNVDFLEANPEFGVVHSDTDYVYSNRVERKHWATRGLRIATGHVFEALLEGNQVMTCSFCCRTALMRQHVNFLEYHRRGYLAADYPMCLDLALHTQFGYLDEALGCYRILRESASHSQDPAKRGRFLKSMQQIKLDYIVQRFVPRPLRPGGGQPRLEHYLRFGYYLRESGYFGEAFRCYYRAGQLWGWDVRTLLALFKLGPAHVTWKLGLRRLAFASASVSPQAEPVRSPATSGVQ